MAVALSLGLAGAAVPFSSAAAAPTPSSVYTAGTAAAYGSTGSLALNSPLVDIVRSATGRGYWQLGSDGGVFSYGDAPFFGSTGDLVLSRPVRSISPTRTGAGYWFVAGDGGIFAFGDAGFFGSTGDTVLNRPVVGMAPTNTGEGYLLVAADGGVFAFGDARFAGSLGDEPPANPVVALSPLPTGDGYWLVDSLGNVYPFGAAKYYGRPGGSTPFADIQATPMGRGYWTLDVEGKVAAFGDAARLQPAVVLGPGERAIGLASTPDGRGLWVATSGRYTPQTATASGPHDFLVRDRLGRPGRWNPCVPVTWLFNPGSAPPGALQLLAEGFEYLGAITKMSFRYGGTTTTIPGPTVAGAIVVGWVSGLGGPSGQATTSTLPTAKGPRITAAGIKLDATEAYPATWAHWGWGPVLLHEIAHALGLGHVNDEGQLMHPVHTMDSPSGFASGDLAGLHQVGAAAGCL